MLSPVGGVDCTASVASGKYCATAVVGPYLANVMDFTRAVWFVPLTAHSAKVYPAGSAAGAWRFTVGLYSWPGIA